MVWVWVFNYSLIDWNFPGALPMSSHNSDKIPAAHEAFNVKQIKELMTNYGPIVEVWFDMSNPTLEQSKKVCGCGAWSISLMR